MNDIQTFVPIIGIVVIISGVLLAKILKMRKEQKPKKRTVKEPKGEPSIPKEEITQAVQTVIRKQPSEHVTQIQPAIEHPEKKPSFKELAEEYDKTVTEMRATVEAIREKTYEPQKPKREKRVLLIRNDPNGINIFDFIVVLAFTAMGGLGAYLAYEAESQIMSMILPLVLGIFCGVLYTDNLRIKRIRKEENTQWRKKYHEVLHPSISDLPIKENLSSFPQEQSIIKTNDPKDSQLKISNTSLQLSQEGDTSQSNSKDPLLSLKQFVQEKSRKSEE